MGQANGIPKIFLSPHLSSQREPPWGKPMASQKTLLALILAANVSLHGGKPTASYNFEHLSRRPLTPGAFILPELLSSRWLSPPGRAKCLRVWEALACA